MKAEEAEEYTQAAAQTLGGGWRFLQLGKDLGVPEALGLSLPQWAERVGGYTKQSIPERREAVAELTDHGLGSEEIADLLGVSERTVQRDKREATNVAEEIEIQAEEQEQEATNVAETEPPEPKPTPEGEQFLNNYLDEDDNLKRREQNRKFRDALRRSWALQDWEPEYVATIVDDDDMTTIDHLIINLTNFRDRVAKTRRSRLAPVREFKR